MYRIRPLNNPQEMDTFVPSGITEIQQNTSGARQVGNLQAYYASLKVGRWENSEKGLELQNGNLMSVLEVQQFCTFLLYTILITCLFIPSFFWY